MIRLLRFNKKEETNTAGTAEQMAADNLEKYTQMIQEFLKEHRPDAAHEYTDTGKLRQWRVPVGKKTMFINLSVEPDDERLGLISVSACMMRLPSPPLLPFYRHLLEANCQFPGAAFGICENEVWDSSSRCILGLNPPAIKEMWNSMVTINNHVVPTLLDEFQFGAIPR